MGASAGSYRGRGAFANVLIGHGRIYSRNEHEDRVQFVVMLIGKTAGAGKQYDKVFHWRKDSAVNVGRALIAIYEKLRTGMGAGSDNT